MTQAFALQATIAALDAQRGVLGDAAVDAAIAALRGHAAAADRAAAATPTALGLAAEPAAHAAVPGPAPLAPAAGPPAAGPRLRQVSVLFVDVAGSTELLSQVGAEESGELLGPALQAFAALVQQHGGLVLRFTGDGLKAVFGAYAMRESEAAQAVQAGLDILQAAEQHAQRWRPRLQGAGFGVRVGIHTGPVLLGGGAEAEHGAIGHAVHLAARLEQSAPVGRLRISHDTWGLVRGLFRVQPQPPLLVKGHDEPLLTYLVMGVEHNPERAVQRGIEGLPTPLIGRDAQLQALLDAHRRAVQQQALQTVTVLADAGVGKTRLRRELLARLQLAHDGDGLLQARAHPDSELQPYGLLRQLLARWLGIADDLDATSARQRLVQGLAPWLGAQAVQRAQIVGQLIGLDFGDQTAVQLLGARDLRQQGFDALLQAVHALAAHAPLVVLLDDLHWADEPSLDFVRQLARPAPVPLLLVMLARPTLLERRTQPPGGDDAAATLLRLQPLDALQGQALASALLRHLASPPPELLNLLVQRTEGNPFYMEELVRMFIDDGVIDATRQPWELGPGWQQEVRVPATLVGVLQARLQSLPADELAALQQASIVGPVFWDAALSAIDPLAPGALPALRQRTLVVAREASAFDGTAEEAFHHQLLHDVTYDTVLKASRREGHARVARWLAERVADRAGEFLGITAAHFERAGDSAQALEFYDRARRDATRRFAHATALHHDECMLRQDALASPMWRHQVLVDVHCNLENLGRLDEAERALQRLAAHAEACDSDALRADVATVAMLAADREGRVDEAAAHARRALALAEPAQASGPAALAHGELAWLALLQQDFAVAQHHIDRGLHWARPCAQLPWREGGAPGYLHQIHVIGVEVLLNQAQWHLARQALQAAMAELPDTRRRERLSMMLQLARTHTQLGDLPQAGRCIDQATAWAAEFRIDRLRADVANARAEWAEHLGDGAAVQQAAEDALRWATGAVHRMGLASASGHLGTAALWRGDRAAARHLWREALRLFEELEVTVNVLDTRADLAELDQLEGRHDEALAEVQAVLAAGVGRAAACPPTGGPAADRWPLLLPATLLRCHGVLAAGDAGLAQAVRAELQRRLQVQLQSLPDADARQRLLQAVPHWRDSAALCGVTRP